MAYLLTGLITIGLVACNHQPNETTKQNPPTKQTQDETTNPPPAPPSQDGSTDQNPPPTPVQEEQVYQNKVFKDVVVTDSGDKLIITGKAQVFEGVFQYVLYDGDKVLIQNNYQTDGAPAWGPFEITIEKNLISTNDVKLELFVFSAKDGSKENTLEIPIPKPE
ncbi:Gmad2 immunoglobulin-like domain-containing protein [Neobacillus drentensis]|uniref:Gmad2 immunoglobulin-like domain-containing protein n=1 Tax=Neobacillus drentensis TaxID=220684 RepID=UPI002FFEA9A6